MPDQPNANQSGNTDSHHIVAVSLSQGIRSIRNIERFLEVSAVVSPATVKRITAPILCVVTWGRKNKQKNIRAEKFAQSNNLPLWYLEDGWIRSCDKDAHSRKTYSLLLDKQGVYYDPTRPCDLEDTLNLPDNTFEAVCSQSDMQTAKKNRQLLVEHEVTKYNYCKESDFSELDPADSRPLVIVIDQTLNDASVVLGGMDSIRFEHMLDTAVAENPHAKIVVRVHPDVVTGKRQGYLLNAARMRQLKVSASGDNPMGWLKRAGKVYVGTSQLGYEALLCGCQVIVFGKPFYAGWGLSDDRAAPAQRTARRSIDQLFHIAHEYYARYINPMTGERWTLLACLKHVIEQKRNFRRNAQHYVCVGIAPWKRKYLERYLRSPEGSVRFSQSNQAAPHEQLLTWSFRDQLKEATRNYKHPKNEAPGFWFRVEDGFLRSSGLGSDYVAPQSLVVDSEGLYFNRHQASELETLLNTCDVSILQQTRAKTLREAIVSVNISKYDVAHKTSEIAVAGTHEKIKAPVKPSSDDTRQRILVIGQVEDDESIRRGCGDVNSNSLLCQQARSARPDACLVYRPHPDVVSGNRKGSVARDVVDSYVDEVSLDSSIIAEIELCDELHTMTSLSGFEALIRQTPVYTYGMPFYAGWGLTNDRMSCDRRTRQRSLDELVYLSLVVYPRYLHVESGEFMTAEQLIEINGMRSDSSHSIATYRWLAKLRNIKAAMCYAA